MPDIDWDQLFGNEKDSNFDRTIKQSFEEEQQRLRAYKDALEDAWKYRPCKETQDRLNGYIIVNRLARLKWIDWVEQRANLGSPAWCIELVGSAIARKLGA